MNHQQPSNRSCARRRVRAGATMLLGLLLAVMAFSNPSAAGIFGVAEARAEELWQATIGPYVKTDVCTNALYANPAVGVCTDIGVAKATTDRIENAIQFELLAAAIYGFLDAATYMAQTMAYDTASWIAEGGPASGPLFYGKGFGDYLTDVGKDAVGEFAYRLSEDFTSEFGLNLCKPPSWQAINLQLALSIPDLVILQKRPTPHCPWTQLTRDWETAAASLSNADALANIGATFQVGGNDLSYALSIHAPLLNAITGSEQAAILDRLEGSGFKAVTDYVTGNIKTPSQTVYEQFNQQLIREPAENERANRSAVVLNAFQLGFVEIGKATVSTFVNTLASKLLSKVMKGLFQPSTQGADGTIDLTNPFAAPVGSVVQRQIFAEQFQDILTPKLTSAEEENILAELQASCTGAGRTRWSCAIDANLALALTQGGMTVREALDKGFINSNAKLIPSSDIEQNQDPTCASNGDRFCVANLRKLRLARIIPIGWELAAESPANHRQCAGGEGCITFGEVVAKFDDCNYDPENGGAPDGVLDDAHPWCHLIDQNWVLAAIPSKCTVKGYGNTLLSGTANRMFECQDSVSCLRRDASGKCTGGYGYCLAEQPYWQFDAEMCKEQFVSCRVFTPRGANAKSIGYLRSTIDYGSCDATNVGCMWYATTRDPARSDEAWTATYGASSGKVYFDSTLAACEAKNDGCTDLRAVVPGEHALNLVENGSFEDVGVNTADQLAAWRRWLPGGGTTVGFTTVALAEVAPPVLPGESAEDGARAVVATASPYIGQGVRFTASRQYALSFYARRGSGAPSRAGVFIRFYAHQNGSPGFEFSEEGMDEIGSTFFRSIGCSPVNAVAGSENPSVAVAVPADLGTDWQRFECSFVPPTGAEWGIVMLSNGAGASPVFDAVKLEESEVATSYADGLNLGLETVMMKVPPEELGCTGADTENPLCANYARVCRQNEAGCDGYRLKREPGSFEIPAVLTPVDVCPAECVGYAEFRKQPSTFDYTHNPENALLDDPDDATIAYFVPNTARFCSAAEVGCEQFTNLGATAEGGDTSAAYSYLRSCQKPSDAAQTFYTWEGSEESGYQLRTWSMVRDLTSPAPQGPAILQKPGPDGILKSPADCNADSYLRGFDPDCRQFYDPQGNVFYRFESQTILSDPACQQFRLDRSSEADCRLTGGSFNADTGSCTYEALGEKSKVCAPASAGCRGYVGTAGKSQATVWSEDFSTDAALANVTANNGAAFARSEESVLVGDTSLRIIPGAGGRMTFAVPTEPGVLYELTFWAKRAGPPQTVNIEKNVGGVQVAIGGVSVSSEWQVYRVGPWAGNDSGTTSQTEITIRDFGNATTFIDKIRVARVSDVTYVIKDSWQTPTVCDQTPEGFAEPHAMLGCDVYINRSGQTVQARQFSRLCREGAIGCRAYVNTENTESPYEMRWERPSPLGAVEANEVTVKRADHFAYYIPSSSKSCPASAKGCRAFGLPQFTQDRLALKPEGADGSGPFKTVYLKDDASQYDEAICSESELFCESYAYSAAGESGTAYFRAPADHACEWKEGVVLPEMCGDVNLSAFVGRTYDGWFKVGTDCPCHPDRLITGSIFGLRYTGDAGYNAWRGAYEGLYDAGETYGGWTATCPAAQAECTEFRDPNDVSDPLHPLGRAYFVLKDGRLDTESCNGQVDPGNGCVLFRDASDSRLLFSSAATEDAYRERAYKPVDPVDCANGSTHPSCERARNALIAEIAFAARSRVIEEGVRDCSGLATDPRIEPIARLLECIEEYEPEAVARIEALQAGEGLNDTNIVVKVNPDRACSQWLACRTGETVYDSTEGAYKNVCSDLALCSASSETGAEGVPYCTNYVNRENERATIFQPFAVTDAKTYASRPVGFGAVDYGGLTVPDHFQVMDTVLKPIGSYLSTDPRVASALKKSYRLGVAVPLQDTSRARRITAAEAASLAGSPELIPYACMFPQTGAIGLVTTADGVLAKGGDVPEGVLCWLSVDQEKPPTIGTSISSSLVSDNLVVPFLEKRFSQIEHPELDQTLSRAFPSTQCKASPEAGAPFGNAYVIDWDASVYPPQPARVADGYANATFCEYGEECECVYKRVSYGGLVKYYEPLSTEVVNAICQGGPRDGLPCVADVSIAGSEQPMGGGATGTASVNYQAPQLQANQQCGSGMCVPILTTTLVRGVTGQCLEYDISRPRPGSGQDECLLWNPNPILTGAGDQFHWQPTAGFQPPQSSGRFYCSSPVKKPRSQSLWPFSWRPKDVPREGFSWENVALSAVPVAGVRWTAYRLGADTLSLLEGSNQIGISVGCGKDMSCISGVGFMPNSEGTFAGRIRALSYADWFTSDGSCVNFLFVGGCTGNESGASLDGHRAEGTQEGLRCEQIDDEGQAFIYKTDAVRLVTTGQGTNRSYAEYAFLMNPVDIAYAALGYRPTDPETVLDYSTEDAIANFEFSVPKGKIGCGYSEVWADARVNDYDGSKDEWSPGDRQWHANFTKYLQEGGGVLDRRNAQIVTEDGTPNGIPVKVRCMLSDADRTSDGEDGLCFIKTWELNYRSEGQSKFLAFTPDIGRESLDRLSTRPLYGKCDASHPWFAVRAVFEDVNRAENDLDELEVSPEQLTGPFQLVGFWVSACAPGDETRYIYMGVKMNSADVCRELLETISKDSHDSAAFTDRNSMNRGYALANGFTWNTTNVPFGASLSTGEAGEQPLYMSGVRQSEVNPLNPPTFTYPGQTYFQPTKYPTSNWGLLSNVFARIYRIYGYSSRAVSRLDWACTDRRSPQFGEWCPNLNGIDDEEKKVEISKQYCGYGGTCVRGSLDAANLFATKACNAFSGVNRGLDCSADPDICHVAPMQEVDGVPTPLYGSCDLFQGFEAAEDGQDSVDQRWEQVGQNYRCTGADCSATCRAEIGCSRATAIKSGAFRCGTGTVRGPDQVRQVVDGRETYASYCTQLSEQSHECPEVIAAGSVDCVKEDGATYGACFGSPWAQCVNDEDCHFEARNYWPSGEANTSFVWSVLEEVSPFQDRLGQWGSKISDERSSPPAEVYYYVPSENVLSTPDFFDVAREAFSPAVAHNTYVTAEQSAESAGDISQFFSTFLTSSGQVRVPYKAWDDRQLLRLYPGFNPLLGSSFDDDSTLILNAIETENLEEPPYISYMAFDATSMAFDDISSSAEDESLTNSAQYGACESVALMWRALSVSNSGVAGTCRGGARAGAACSADADCWPSGITQIDQDRAEDWCNPVTSGNTGNQDTAYGWTAVSDDCWPDAFSANPNNPRHPRTETDPALDSNLCTRPAGYWPRPNNCLDPTDEYCGLFGYDLGNRSESVDDAEPLPTDVTAGLYTPRFLNPDEYGSDTVRNYSYVDYYNPEPPHTAAPDIRSCLGQRCRVSGLDTISMDGLVGGTVNGGVNNHVSTLRFYAWASHEQMPLRKIVVDWGDGAITELPDAYMKNRKPFCSTPKECTEMSGLTCETDHDCPPGGGSCATFGNCSNNPNIRCMNDQQCSFAGETGRCERRIPFGNSQDACEERYLEFRHSYACPANAAEIMRSCSVTGVNRCARDNAITCGNCGVGDACVNGMAPPSEADGTGGCYDAVNNRCLYTPRVMITDNWGWCSGECRNSLNASGQLVDLPGSRILHPNGGCYDASRTKSNVNLSTAIGPNECAFSSSNTNLRPWIVFPGAVSLLPGERL